MNTSHLTPEKLLGTKPLPEDWRQARTAFICFTPFPNGFLPYVVETAKERYFLHSPNSEVKLCQYEGHSFWVISEVYGFAVGATTVEELVHYGVETIIGIGYVGAFKGAALGQSFLARNTLSDIPLARHYGIGAFEPVYPTESLYLLVKSCAEESGMNWGEYRVWNSNSLYRESPELIASIKQAQCEVVNMDTLAIYAVTPVCAQERNKKIAYLYVGTVTDSEKENGQEEWESDLLSAVKREDAHPHDMLVTFMVEQVLTRL
ncbi:MAG: hypothetical protein AAF587_33425 [Bacteroidota bacterium]